MARMITPVLALSLVIAGATSGSMLSTNSKDEAAAQPPGFKHENNVANLKALFQEIQRAVAAKDVNKAAALNRSVMPNEVRIKKGLRDDVPADNLTQIVNLHIKLNPANDKAAADLIAPKADQTEVKVHAATTDEIAKYAPGSVAYNEFPGGTQKLAEKVLRPGMTYYEVEFVAQGAKAGIRYHLLFWDGTQWSMLEPIWRSVKE